jgi:nondiscriminating glutamyl-tRNA synthetase
MVRTRFAPSPTGSLHLGNARTAALNWLYARQQDGAFILRFEDTDLERHVEGAERDIRDALEWLGLAPDEGPFAGGEHGPYRQSERVEIYREHAERLLAEGQAYRCYCTPEELEARRAGARAERGDVRYDGRCRRLSSEEESRLIASGPPASIRFRVEPDVVHYRDRVRGNLTVEGEQLGDQVILRSDGRPTYNFAVVVDDLLMGITHVIRGSGHLSNTPKQVLFYEALGAVPPEFLHLPSVLAPGGGKLSKRAGAPGLLEYRDQGYHPDGLLNYLSLLSWSSPSGTEVLSRDQLIAEVDLDRIGVANPEVDPEKLRWLSGQHYRHEAIDVLERVLRDRWEGRFEPEARQLRALAEVLRERIQILADADPVCELVLPKPDLSSTDAVAALQEPTAGGALRQVAQRWEILGSWARAELKEELAAAGREAGLKGRLLYHPVRAALTGAAQGPDVPDVAYILGRETTVERLEAGLEAAESGEAGGP